MATLKDVAELAGVGLGTASRVVSGNGSVSKATAEKVRAAIEQLGFQPSHAARSLMLGNSQTIGVYIPYVTGTFYSPILALIYGELRAAGLNMVVAFGSSQLDERSQVLEGIDFLNKRGCDGVIALSVALREEDIEALGVRSARLVLLNHYVKSIAPQCFTVDHVAAGRLAARALLDAGHQEFALITGPRTAIDNVERVSGFLDELADNGIDVDGVWVAESDFSPEGGRSSARALIESGYPCTALFCANDDMAIGALSYLHSARIDVPGQVSVLGYDDTMSAEYAAPRLASVHLPWNDMTLDGLNWLLNLCYGGDRPTHTAQEVRVTLRDSVGPPPR
ncbi:MAG: LacI family DNA-binding transcriptional regulator [Gammaproteobacteria bacterium]